MTPDQEHILCNAAAMGIVCGLRHRYEWYINADRALVHGPYAELKENARKLADAFMAFERKLASCDEGQAELDRMTYDDYVQRVNSFYNAGQGFKITNSGA